MIFIITFFIAPLGYFLFYRVTIISVIRSNEIGDRHTYVFIMENCHIVFNIVNILCKLFLLFV